MKVDVVLVGTKAISWDEWREWASKPAEHSTLRKHQGEEPWQPLTTIYLDAPGANLGPGDKSTLSFLEVGGQHLLLVGRRVGR